MPTCQPIIVTNPESETDRPDHVPAGPVTIESLFGLVQNVLEQNRALLERIDQLEENLAIARPKETYTVEEAAERLNRRPYTVRQWCNKGQVKDVYKVRGKGRQGEWRIPHEVLVKLQAEGPGPERGTAA
jgi:hypothetical protein